MNNPLNQRSKNIEAIYPLAPMQQGLLFHTIMNPGAGMYLLQYRHVMVLDDLNVDAFQRAWDAVVDRHELLRTSFVWKKQARPLQVVHKKVDLPVEILSWEGLEADEQERRLAAMLFDERQEELAFHKAPLMRVRLIKLAENRYQFVRSYHHILMDAWCFSVIMMDFLAFYRALCQNQSLSLAKPRPYQDFIEWLESQDNDNHQAFWQSRLAGFDTPTPLGIRQVNQFSNDEAVVDTVEVLSKAQSQKIQRAASLSKVTINTLLQGAWALLLSRYSGETDVVFGVTVAGRPTHMAGIESVVGLFINSLPLRVNVNSTSDLLAWLQALQSENLVLREHETSSLTDIQQWSEVDKQDLFQSLFVFENAPMDAGLEQENLEFIVENATNRTHTNYPITVVVIPGQELHLQITYQSRDFEHSAVEKMLQHFTSLVNEMSACLLSSNDVGAQVPVQLEQLSMLSQEDLEQQHDWGQGDVIALDDDYIQRFEAQVIATPDRTLVADTEQVLDYKTVNQRANLLAHRLIAEGVTPDTVIAVLGERNAEFLVMILGVLKSGAGYLPLDPKHPPLRLAQVIKQSQTPFLLVNDSNHALASQSLSELGMFDGELSALDGELPVLNQEVSPTLIHFSMAGQVLADVTNPKVSVDADTLAYVIFTSGSTGTPKGVMVTRQGMLNNMIGKLSPLSLSQSDVIAQTASQCFDISVWQFLIAPIIGARVEILPDCISHDAPRLVSEIQKRCISIIEPVPSLLKGIVEQRQDLTHLRWVLPTGEALPPVLAQQWHDQYPSIALMNAYGPAECSDDVAFYPIIERLDDRYSHVPIGQATANNQLYLLSPELTLMPVGAIGEVYVAGTGVGRGYLNEPKRTAGVFLPNPFVNADSTQGERLYRTGDLARLLADGNLQYVGRTDYQVKVRGYRIELGEIESRLVKHPDIQEVVVVAVDDRQRGKILVAYLGLDRIGLDTTDLTLSGELVDDAALAARQSTDDGFDMLAERLSDAGRWSGLRTFVSDGLPEYMVPTAFIALPVLPRNPNGKVDRSQLPEVDFNRQQESSYVAPRNDIEQQICHIWQTLLGLKKVGINDNFFELGGHSLLATQLVGQLSQLLGHEVTLRSVFEHPSIEAWSDMWQQQKDDISSALPPLIAIKSNEQAGNRHTIRPLSFVQQRLWFLQRLEPDSSSYNLPAALRLQGSLNERALSAALDQLVSRYDVLRTQFIVENEKPVQYIHSNLSISINHQQVSDEDELTACLRAEAMTPFVLDQAPLLRVSVYQNGNQPNAGQILSFNCHHIIADAWSLRLLIEEFCQIYNNAVHGQSTTLPVLPIQYSDYAVWQTHCLQSGLFEPQLGYWKGLLSGDLPTLELNLDFSRPTQPSHHGARYDIVLPAELAMQLQQANHSAQRGHFTIMLAAFELLLGAYSGQRDILIGVPVANRHHSATQSLMGCFINTLVHRADLSPEQTVTQLLDAVERQSIDAQANQDLPFDYLIDQLGVDRQLSYNPLFQAMFNFVSGKALDAFQLDGVDVEPIDNRPDTALCDFKLDVQHRPSEQGSPSEHANGDSFNLSFEYSTELFEPSTVMRMANDFQRLLQWMLVNQNTQISQINLWDFNQENKDLKSVCNVDCMSPDIVSDFQSIAAVQPDLIAVKGQLSGSVLSNENDKEVEHTVVQLNTLAELNYKQLDQASDDVAAYLQTLGVGVGDRVGIFIDRNVSMLTSMLAILKVGAAYVPIDPNWPQERARYILDHAKPLICIVDDLLCEQLQQWAPGLRCISSTFDDLSDRSSKAHTPFVAPTVHSLQTAYVLYTSGSTGRPKGVEVNRGNLNNLFNDLRTRLSVSKGQTILALTSYCFDISMVEFLLPLTQGASTLIASRDQARDPKLLEQLLNEHVIDIMQATPATWSMLLARTKRRFTGMTLLSVGEVLSTEVAKQMLAREGRVVNFYGPTEVTIYATYKNVLSTERSSVPIGRDLLGVQSYILDEQLRHVPEGVIGELYLGGDNVATGYFNAPRLTAAAFMPNPFSAQMGERMYKTGDLVRRNNEGELDYIGRNDFQVKLRGFRIELGEIEALLPQLNGVDNAAVILASLSSEPNAIKDQLMAYWCGSETDQAILQNHLKAHLPEYMVPAHFQRLDALPLNSNEKIDRKALPNVVSQQSELSDVDASTPRTVWQTQLVQLWQELFDNRLISINDNFFAVGGHSLLAARLVAKLSEQYKIELPLKAIFETPVLAELAQNIERNEVRYQQSQTQQQIIADPDTDKKAMYSTQQRLWFMERFNGSSRAYQLNTALKVEGKVDVGAFSRALGSLVERQHSLRTVFGDDNGQLFQQVLPEITLPLNVFNIDEATLQSRLEQASDQVFDTSKGPSWRVHLYAVNTHDEPQTYTVVQLCMHHIIADAWSLNIMLNELQALYSLEQTNSDKQKPELAQLPFQFGDFSAWWQSDAAKPQLAQDSQYWQNQLSGESPILGLPNDFPRPKQQSFNGQRLRFTLDSTLIEQLQQTSAQNGVTAFVALLNAWQLLLARYSGQNDVRVGIPVANRHHAHSNDLIGYFASTQVIRSPLNANDSVVSFWQQSSATLLEAQQHQSLPFEQLVDVLKVPRSTTHSPLFQTMFNLIQMPSAEQSGFAGLNAERLSIEDNTSITDISLQIETQSDQWQCVLEYNTDLFLPSTAQRYARQYVHVLQQMLTKPEQALSQISPLDESDYQSINASNNTATSIDYVEQDFVTQFDQQVALTPNNVAISYQQSQMTYRELNQKVNQLANHLTKQLASNGEAVTEQRVAVCLERAPQLLIALIAVQKVGAVYIPLDPLQPKDRLHYICQHAKPSVLITQDSLADLLQSDQMESVSIDAVLPESAIDDVYLAARVHPAQLAYIIYTSGSTGKPKGVSVSRGNLTNFLASMNQTIKLDQDDRWLAITTAGFDISALEFYLPLIDGANIILASSRDAMDGAALFGLLQQATVFQATPASWQLLLAQEQTQWPAIRGLVGGEAVPGHLASELINKGVELYNVYGPTETTIWSTQQPLIGGYDGIAPIGLPINNTRCYVLDEQLQLVPEGAAGELYIAGAGVARGYQFAPALSAAAFIPDVFANDGSRMYKTGDVVRRLNTGVLDYIGRTDFQIKIRGFRIELGEIESCLRGCGPIAEAVVVADEQQRLLAYVELTNKPDSLGGDDSAIASTFDSSQTVASLAEKLPAYMLPYMVIAVDKFPLNSNGKVDRKALTALSVEQTNSPIKQISRAPQSELEKELATIWQSLLGLKGDIGVDDNFFELGGHSLLAMQLITQVEKQFSVRLALQALFEAPTITGLSNQIDNSAGTDDDDALDFMDQLLNEFED